MKNSFEIFSLNSSLVYADSLGLCVRDVPNLSTPCDYLVIRRSSESLPQARIITLILNEFLNWHLGNVNHFEAFSDLSHRDFAFLNGDLE